MSTNKEESTVKDNIEEVLDDAIDKVSEEQENKGETEEETTEVSELETLKEDLQKEKDKFLRLFAEFENFKKRTSRERMELYKTANQEMMGAMLPVLDDFDRAHSEISKAKDKNLSKGVELIHNKLRDTLVSKGLTEMKVKEGDTFDAEIPAPKDKLKGKIVDVVEKGYKLGERIIRYPKVVTGM